MSLAYEAPGTPGRTISDKIVRIGLRPTTLTPGRVLSVRA